MSVFTSIDENELRKFLADYRLGQLEDFTGIPSGITNTNYFVTTDHGHYVLTIFERLTTTELPFFLNLTAFLAEHGIPCAHPISNNAGGYLGQLKGKPAALIKRLHGKSVQNPTARHCAAVGRVLAQLHTTGRAFPQSRVNDRGLKWWKATTEALAERLNSQDAELLHEELRFQSLYMSAELPRGIIHADLFRDNVLFNGETISGLVDFYYACTDAFMFDIAVTVNDWCIKRDDNLDYALMRRLLSAYQGERAMTAIERDAWPAMLRAAALRFWLSRLYDLHFPADGEMTYSKDPGEFRRILVKHIDNEYAAHSAWPEARGKQKASRE